MPLRALTLAALTITLLSGCGGHEPTPQVQAAPSATPTSSLTAKPETAEEFIHRWNDEQGRMQDGDTSAYRALVPDCAPCMQAADLVDSIYAAGGTVRTGGRTIQSITKRGSGEDQEHVFRVVVESSPTILRESADAPPRRLLGGRSIYDVTLTSSDSGWTLEGYTKVITS